FASTDRIVPALSLALAGSLMLGGTACVGFINGEDADDEVGDGDTGEGDGDGDSSGAATIYAIQQGEIGEGTIVTVEGRVVASPINQDLGLVFVEEPDGGQYSGISLYLWSEVVMSTALSPGDVVDVTGEYTEYYGMSQLVVKNPGDVTVVGSAAVPGPDVVTAAAVARSNT